MDDRMMKDLLMRPEQHWDTRMAVHKLSPEIRATAARIRKQKQERTQLLGFIAAALALVCAAAYVLMEYYTYSAITEGARAVMIAFAACAGIAVASAPILAYFAEEDMNHESA